MNDKRNTPTSVKRPTPSEVSSITEARANRTLPFDAVNHIPFQEGEEITVEPGMGYLVRGGRIAVQRDLTTPSGIRTFSIDILEKGDTINMHELFGLPSEAESHNRYVAMTLCDVSEVTREDFDKILQQQPGLYVALKRESLRSARQRTQIVSVMQANDRKTTELRASNESLRASHAAARESLEGELQHIAERSQENYAELERLQAMETTRWFAIEEIFKRRGIDKLSEEEIQLLLGIEAPSAETPPATGAEAFVEEVFETLELDLEPLDDDPESRGVDELLAVPPSVDSDIDEALRFVREEPPARKRMETLSYGDFIPKPTELPASRSPGILSPVRIPPRPTPKK